MVGIPGLSFTSQKTSVSSQQSQNLNFVPSIVIQSPNSSLEPATGATSDQTATQAQNDTLSGLPSSTSSIFDSLQEVLNNTPDDVSAGSSTAEADIFGGNALFIGVAAIAVVLFMAMGKKRR